MFSKSVINYTEIVVTNIHVGTFCYWYFTEIKFHYKKINEINKIIRRSSFTDP